MEFKDRIAEIRQNNNYSLTQMAGILEKTEGAIRAWESGRTKPDIETLLKLASKFKCSTDYLLGLIDTKESKYSAVASDLGLGDNAVDNLLYCKEGGLLSSEFIGSACFKSMMMYVTAYKETADTADLKHLGLTFHESIPLEQRRKLILAEIEDGIKSIVEDL